MTEEHRPIPLKNINTTMPHVSTDRLVDGLKELWLLCSFFQPEIVERKRKVKKKKNKGEESWRGG